MTASRPLVSVLIPVFNGGPLLRDLHRELAPVLDTLAGGTEIVFVDDGSRDDSLQVLRALQEHDSRIRVIELAMNCGQHAAFSAALEHARGRYLVTMDADLQCDPRDIPKLLAPLDQGFDMVSGVRLARRDPLMRRMLSAMVTRIVGGMTRIRLRDMGCPFNAMTDRIAHQIAMFGELRRFLKPLAVRLATRVTEVEVAHRERSARQPRSSYSVTALVRLFMDFLVTSLGNVFAWVFIMGAGLVLICAALLATSVLAWSAGALPGLWVLGATGLVTLALLVALLGLAGDYLQRIHRQTSGLPLYVIQAIHEAPTDTNAENRLTSAEGRSSGLGTVAVGEGQRRGN